MYTHMHMHMHMHMHTDKCHAHAHRNRNPNPIPNPNPNTRYRTRSILAMPFERVSSGELMGVCEVTNKQLQGDGTGDGLIFDAADEQLLSTLLKLVALTVDSQR